MARLITSGFELQDRGSGVGSSPVDGAVGATGTYETTIVRSGSASLKVTAAGGAAATASWTLLSPIALATDAFLRAYIYVPTGGLPSITGFPLKFLTAASAALFGIQMNTDGTLTLISGASTAQGSNSSAIALDTWNKIELRGQIGTGAVDQCEGRLNDVSFASASGLTVSDTQIGVAQVGFGATNPTVTLYVDDVAINDATGSAQNTWPGSSKIVLLLPTGDSAKGTGWTNDAAGTTNLFDALDNKPPVGIADTTGSTGLHQIRNATANANSSYDATMTTYTAAGIGASDTINVLSPVVATAAPVVTSAKQGTVGVSSNPVIANVALQAAGTAGAFWQGNAAGTYLGGWKWSYGTITYAPSVTLGTAPVMRITQVTSSTRIAMVCAMGIYVDYTPAASAQLISQPSNLANFGML